VTRKFRELNLLRQIKVHLSEGTNYINNNSHRQMKRPRLRKCKHGRCAMQVKDAMHKGAEWVAPDTPLSEVAKKMRDLDIGALPVGENDRLIGMVTDRDIACRAFANGRDVASLTVRDVMSKGIVYCTETEDLGDAIRLMEDKKIRRLPVINDKKRMVGMLSLGDVSHAASRELSGEVIAAVSAHHA
jgi:CBS domain-containing protein